MAVTKRYSVVSSHLRGRRFGRRGRMRLVWFLVGVLLVGGVILAPGIRVGGEGRFKVDDDDAEVEREALGGGREGVVVDGPESVEVKRISVVVLFHNEYETLKRTLESWDRNGLYWHVAEVLFFLNGMRDSEQVFRDKLPVLKGDKWKGLVRVVSAEENLKLGVAITRLVELAHEENVLLLEKDWALIEDERETGRMLRNAVWLLEKGGVDVVRFRHRDRPGAPLHARIMHENREDQMMKQQPNMYCYLHHWVPNPVERYPQYFRNCSQRVEDEGTWCATARYCQWTNNPAMFRREWFMEWLGDKYTRMYEHTVKTDPGSNRLDFEFWTYWTPDVWNDRDFVVALPKGLFEHQEVGEQNLMNTVWYAWNRLSTDVEEKMRALWDTEKEHCKSSDKSLESGPTFKEKFPIDFVRLYHYNRSMQCTVEEAVGELEEKSEQVQHRLEDGHGSWRNGVTDLTNFWYQVVLYAYPVEPKDMKISFVTALFSTEGQAELEAKDIERACANLDKLSGYSMVLYCTAATKEAMQKTLKEKYSWEDSRISSVEFAVRGLDDMVNALLGVENVERIRKANSSSEWSDRVEKRSGGVVPTVESLTLSMSKPYILHDAMHRGLGRSSDGPTHYVWFDALSKCLDKLGNNTLHKGNDHVLRGNLLLHALVSGVRVKGVEELETALAGSGFSREGLLKEMEVSEGKLQSDGLVLMDFKTLGGSRLAISLMKGYYDVVLRDMLRRNEIGSGREALSIAHKNVDYNFRLFRSVEDCRPGDTSCGQAERVDSSYMREDGENGCKLYGWAGSCGG